MVGHHLNSILGVSIVVVLLNAHDQINGGILPKYLVNYRGIGVVRVEDMKL